MPDAGPEYVRSRLASKPSHGDHSCQARRSSIRAWMRSAGALMRTEREMLKGATAQGCHTSREGACVGAPLVFQWLPFQGERLGSKGSAQVLAE